MDSDIELRFLRVVGRNGVHVAQPSEVKETSFHNPNSTSRSGFAMQVTEGTWKGRIVAVKRIKHTFVISGEQGAEEDADTLLQYEKSMEDLSFELQIMSKSSLRHHRNIVELLAVTFRPPSSNDTDVNELILPSFVMELAHTRFPDLSLFLDREHNPSLHSKPSFEVAAGLIADIADGLAVLHTHDVVHADLKPKNILIFPDTTSPNGVLAKLSDFGFSGLTTYTWRGQRAWLGDGGRPRGGTAEWSAPECLGTGVLPVMKHYQIREEDRDKSQIDLYSYGLLASYIGLWGQNPRSFIDSLEDAKLNDEVVGIISRKLRAYYAEFTGSEQELGGFLIDVVEQTLQLDPQSRTIDLKGVRKNLFGSHPYEDHFPPVELFVLDFNLFPQTAQEFHRDGLFDAYWNSPKPIERGFTNHL
ncbi:kinase-like domain-containing protein [Cyathus striatus]|nr:kinase-like domain-containing protein [Cyathus striatus]